MSNKFLEYRQWVRFKDMRSHVYAIDWNNPVMPLLTWEELFWNTSDIDDDGDLQFTRDVYKGHKERVTLYTTSHCQHRLFVCRNRNYGYYDTVSDYEIVPIDDE